MKAVGDGVEIDETRGPAGGEAAVGGDLIELLHRGAEDVRQHLVIVLLALSLNIEHDLLGEVDGLVRVDPGLALVAELDDAGARIHKLAERGLLRHDVGVVAGVGSRGHGVHERVQVRGATSALQVVIPLQAAGEDEGIDLLVLTKQVNDGGVDDAVHRPVEIVRLEHLEHVREDVRGRENRAQHALLRLDIVRGQAPGLVGYRATATARTAAAPAQRLRRLRLQCRGLTRGHVVIIKTGGSHRSHPYLI